MMGSTLAGAFALAAVGTLCGQPLGVSLNQAPGSPLEAISRVWAMGQDFGFVIGMPVEWKPAVLQELKGGPSADAGVLEQVGQMALSQQLARLGLRRFGRGPGPGKCRRALPVPARQGHSRHPSSRESKSA